jgi:hypothetical protein
LQAQVLAEAKDGGLTKEGLVVELQGIGKAELCCVSGGLRRRDGRDFNLPLA